MADSDRLQGAKRARASRWMAVGKARAAARLVESSTLQANLSLIAMILRAGQFASAIVALFSDLQRQRSCVV
jgi:hypothetical protein